MENRFINVTDEELTVYCQQFKEWQKTGELPDNELGKMRDIYSLESNVWQVVMIDHLLDVLMDRWLNKIGENKCLE